jgi:hypothetical protein
MRFACWIKKATDTHLEYVIFIAFPRQQRLKERSSILRHSTSRVVIYAVMRVASEPSL